MDAMPANCLRWQRRGGRRCPRPTDHRHPSPDRRTRTPRWVIISRDWHTRTPPLPLPPPSPACVDCPSLRPNGVPRAGGPINLPLYKAQSHLRRNGITNSAWARALLRGQCLFVLGWKPGIWGDMPSEWKRNKEQESTNMSLSPCMISI